MLGVLALAGHDTFPSSRRVPTAGSAFWSRRMTAWFTRDDATEIVKICYDFACVVLRIRIQAFPKFYRCRRDIRACWQSYAVIGVTFWSMARARADVTARDHARYNNVSAAIHCIGRAAARGSMTVRSGSLLLLRAAAATSAPTFPTCIARAGQDGPSIHLSHAGSDQDLSGQPQGAREHPPVVLPGRQDRRARRQRLGQVDAAAHHGRHRHRSSSARAGSPRARASATCRRSRSSTRPRPCART